MAHMNGGFEKHGLDEDAFGPEGGLSNLKTFDAFRKLPLLDLLQENLRVLHNQHLALTSLPIYTKCSPCAYDLSN